MNQLRRGVPNLAHEDASIRDNSIEVKSHGTAKERHIRGEDQSGRQTAGELPFSKISFGHQQGSSLLHVHRDWVLPRFNLHIQRTIATVDRAVQRIVELSHLQAQLGKPEAESHR
jgi:hypothetical protein